MNFDGPIDIAVGQSRNDLHWKNKRTTWSKIVSKLSQTHRTHETQAEYFRMKPDRQDAIKDIGGFVGGYLNGGRRKKENVLHRQLVTLDLDNAPLELWDDITLFHDFAVAMYSTHKHTPEAPRLRLVIPLSREVSREEYTPIALRLAYLIAGQVEENLAWFDPTTFEATRLMYWPSTSKDAQYVFEVQDAQWADADSLLASYTAWRDQSCWPQHPAWKDRVHHEAKKAGEPTEKPGIVGAFCRAYTISEAIETFLSDVYTPSDVDGRYTYIHGSTGGGLVTYEDKFAYSHHGTDPTSGQLCNAFDLVRIHLYGLQDEKSHENTPINKRPSYTAMQDMATQDDAVKAVIGKEKMERVALDFDVIEGTSTEANHDWLTTLEVDKKGNYLATAHNVEVILENDPALRGKFGYNEFTCRETVNGNLPWRKKQRGEDYFGNQDAAGLRAYIEKAYGISSPAKLQDGLLLAQRKNAVHPVREYLDRIVWDEVPRLDTLLVDYLGAEDNKLNRLSMRKAAVSAVARIYRPGCQVDHVLTLVGPQGCYKSTFLRRLGKQWYSENLPTVHGKEAAEQLQGVWIMEMGELAALKRAESEAIKSFITKQIDDFRPAYAEKKERFPRQCVFFGTTNNLDFLKDPTGNRRFWPVQVAVSDDYAMGLCKNVAKDLTPDVVDQVWAEAVVRYRAGETLFLDREDADAMTTTQRFHTEKDDRTGLIEQYLNAPLPDDWEDLGKWERKAYIESGDYTGTRNRDAVSTLEIWVECLGGKEVEFTTPKAREISNALIALGWALTSKIKTIKPYGRQRVYERTSDRKVLRK